MLLCNFINILVNLHYIFDKCYVNLCYSTTTEVPPHKDKKYIVHQEQLLGLFQRCPVCSSICTVDTMTVGTLLRVTQQCGRCDHFNQWSSQPTVNNIPAGNLQLCASVLFTGSSFRQISKVEQFINKLLSLFKTVFIL